MAQTLVEDQITRGTDAARDTGNDRGRALSCLATAIAYEAGYEPVEGQQAVAEVILNRLRHPAFPKSVCGVIFAGAERQRRTGCQFSFACDGALNRRLPPSVMASARAVAAAALDGQNPPRVAGATHYHADYVSPYWAPSLIRIAKIGLHIFYRGAGSPDQREISEPYIPFGEPTVAQLAGSLPSASGSLTSSKGASPPPASAFAPWGISPLQAALPPG